MITINNMIGGKVNLQALPSKYKEDGIYNAHFSYELKYYSCHNRMLYLNNVIERIYNTWVFLKSEPKIEDYDDRLYEITIKHNVWQNKFILSQYEHEEFITQLRKIVDDLLVMYCISRKEFKNNNHIYDGLGDVKREIEAKFKELKKFEEFFNCLLNISNGIKHSVAHSILPIIGENEPCLFSSYFNKNKSKTDIVIVGLDDIIKKFNSFYLYIDEFIKRN